MHFQRRLLGDPRQAVDGVDDRIGRRAGSMGHAFAVQPVGRGAGELLLEEGRLVDAVGPALAGDGSARDVRDHRLGDVDVVVEHLGLGRTRRRVQHLVRVGQLHPADSIHHAKVIPAVPLSDEANFRCLPDGGRCRGRRRSACGRRIRPISCPTARAIRPRWTTTAGRWRTRCSPTTPRGREPAGRPRHQPGRRTRHLTPSPNSAARVVIRRYPQPWCRTRRAEP